MSTLTPTKVRGAWTVAAFLNKGHNPMASRLYKHARLIAGLILLLSLATPPVHASPAAPASNTWETRAPMPTPRGAAASAVLNNKIYVMGGWTTQDSAVVEVYDPATNTWSTKAPMPTPRNNLAATALNGKIYAIGGWSGTANTNVVEVYDPTSNTWSSAAPLPVATNGLRACLLYTSPSPRD